MQQLERIQAMEQAMQQASAAVAALSGAAEQYRRVLPQLKQLESYYTSDQWQQDFADEEAGKFPADLPRGVLSEDGIYNLLTEHQELLDDLRALAAQHQK